MIIKKSTSLTGLLVLAVILVIFGLYNHIFLLTGIILASVYIFISGTEAIYGLFFILPFSPILKISPDGNTFFNVLIAVYILRMIFLNKKFKVSIYQLLSLLVFSIFCLVNGGDPNLNSIKILMELVIYFVLAILVMNDEKEINIRKVIMFFVMGIIFASLLGYFNNYIPGLSQYLNESSIKLDNNQVISRFSGIQNNPNFYTMDLTIAISSLLYMLSVKQSKWYDYILIMILLGFGILSLSLSFVITMLIIFSLYLIYKLTKTTWNINAIIKGIIGVSLVIFLVIQISNIPYLDIIMQRLGIDSATGKNLSQITTGRSDIWAQYLSFYFSDLRRIFFGVGLSIEQYNLEQSHNYYLELFVYLGIIGSIIYLNLLNSVFRPFKKTVKGNLICLLPLVAFVVRGFGINLMFRESFVFYLIICMIIIGNSAKANKIENKITETDIY
ncbi:hypothetical protein GH810_11160 [Acetobacterium paludosum]|uniref:O-antigen ligase domain-containing protein n=1 Tax=Acetobacterium paludosum TaxID=52693 RepID=A0A923HWG4_9FIRM|nr:hypothetical protein [Acetobacterium paludosum]MBC3888872.1 hypothetical protein [Acetobacterium paludosum]